MIDGGERYDPLHDALLREGCVLRAGRQQEVEGAVGGLPPRARRPSLATRQIPELFRGDGVGSADPQREGAVFQAGM